MCDKPASFLRPSSIDIFCPIIVVEIILENIILLWLLTTRRKSVLNNEPIHKIASDHLQIWQVSPWISSPILAFPVEDITFWVKFHTVFTVSWVLLGTTASPVSLPINCSCQLCVAWDRSPPPGTGVNCSLLCSFLCIVFSFPVISGILTDSFSIIKALLSVLFTKWFSRHPGEAVICYQFSHYHFLSSVVSLRNGEAMRAPPSWVAIKTLYKRTHISS